VVRGVKSINHSQFVDDTLLLSGASSIMEKRFKMVLDIFTRSSREGLTTIKYKSMHGMYPRDYYK
jgi:hypothetical protein